MRMLILCCVAVLALTPVASTEVYVTTEWNGLLCGGLYYGDFSCDIKIANPDPAPVDSAFMMFTFTKPVVQGIHYVGVSYANGWEGYFGGGFWDGCYTQVQDEDSLFRITIFAYTDGDGFPPAATGLPCSSDTVTYITLTFDMGYSDHGGDVACFDSSSSAEWVWSFGPTQTASWSGEECFVTQDPIPDCCFVEFTLCPGTFSSWSWNEEMRYRLWAQSAFYRPVGYVLLSGPGSVDWHSGWWTYEPTEEDAGTHDTVVVQAVEDWCGDSSYIRIAWWADESYCRFPVNVGAHGPPQFLPTPQHFLHSSGETLEINVELEGENPCNGCTWWCWIPEGAIPPGYMDSSTGTFYYQGTEADTNTYYVAVCFDQDGYGDTSGFYIHHYDSASCGDINHYGGTDIADLVWLVDFMFFSGPSPVPLASGNVDCVEGVDISDLVYYVDWMFLDGPAPCEGCP